LVLFFNQFSYINYDLAYVLYLMQYSTRPAFNLNWRRHNVYEYARSDIDLL